MTKLFLTEALSVFFHCFTTQTLKKLVASPHNFQEKEIQSHLQRQTQANHRSLFLSQDFIETSTIKLKHFLKKNSIKVSKQFNIKLSTCKAILHIYQKEGRLEKKQKRIRKVHYCIYPNCIIVIKFFYR